MNKKTMLVIGAGRMAEAIIAGLLRTSKESIESIIVSNQKNIERLHTLQQKYGIHITPNWRRDVEEADVIILAMPPGAHALLLAELSGLLTNQLIVTVAAGLGPSYLEEHLPSGTPVAWVMPNTAAMAGESMSLYTVGTYVKEEHLPILHMILAGMGQSQQCTEEEVHRLTAVTGSAPAFLYYFAESLIQVTKELGIEEAMAKKLVAQMIYGSSVMLKQEENPAMLREQVATPGGATAEGLRVLCEKQFMSILKQAVEATNKKARESGSAE